MTPAQKRALIQQYKDLPDTKRYMIEFVAFCEQHIPHTELLKALTNILPRMLDGTAVTVKEIFPIYTELIDSGLLCADHQGTTVPDVIFECALRDGLKAARHPFYRLSSVTKPDHYSYHWYGRYQLRRIEIQIREALYSENVPELVAAYDLFLKSAGDMHGQPSALPLASLLSNGDDFSWLEKGPTRFLITHLPAAIEQTQLHHSQAVSFVAPLVSFLKRCPAPETLDEQAHRTSLLNLMLLAVGECWLCHQMPTAVELTERMTGYHRSAALAIIAFAAGKMEDAVQLFDSATKEMRKQHRRKRLFFNNIAGQIFVSACLRHNQPDTLLRLKEWLNDAASRTNKSPYQDVFSEFNSLVDARLTPDSVVSLRIHVPWGGAIDSTERVIASVWVHILYSLKLARQRERAAQRLQQQRELIDGTPHCQTVVNIAALCSAILDRPVQSPFRDGPAPSLDTGKDGNEAWRLVLHNISRIGQKAESEKNVKNAEADERVIFRIAYESWDERYRVFPFIQKAKRGGGWTKGKALALKHRDNLGLENPLFGQTESHIVTLLAAEKTRSERSTREYYEENHNEVLYRLAGYPNLFWETAKGAPLEIETAAPQVEVIEVNGDIEIRMYPSDPCEKGYVVEKRGANLLRVTRFNKAQLELLAALGENGVRFPAAAKNEIAKAVTHIGALSEVHSHVPDVGKKSVTMAAVDTLLIRMQPFLNGLSAQFLVTPLGPDGPSFVPGHGPEHVFATVGDEKRTAQRGLEIESQKLDKLLMDLGLYYVEESGDGLYQFPEEPEAVEFLSELENCNAQSDAPSFEVEWPKGVKLSCTKTLFPKDISLLINKKRKWLALGGSVKIDNKTVYRIEELLGAQESPKPGFIRLKDGQFLRLSKSLKKFLSHLGAMGETDGDGFILAPENAAISVMKLANEAGHTQANAAWEQTVARIDKSLTLESKVPRQVKATLRDYQRDGYRWLHRLSALGVGACLADDMGLGKTLQTLALMQHRRKQPKLKKPSLVVAPVSVIPGWFDEAARFVPGLNLVNYAGSHRKKIIDELKPGDVLVTSYGLLQRDGARLAKVAFDMIVLDEAQFIKNRDAARTKSAFKLQGDFKMVTTGTPVENRLGEFWSIFNFINPGLLGTYKSFAQLYEKSFQLFGDATAIDALRWQVKPFLLRRTKDETLDELPPKTEIVRYCEMSKEEAAFYELKRRRAKELLKLSDSKKQMMELITALTTLRQAACHPGLIDPSLKLESTKLACLKDILVELKEGGHQALIFSQFVKFLTIVRRWLDEQGITYQYMDGGTSAKRRTAAVNAFQAGESDLFLISMRAGGFGLNLTAADYVVHLDPWWNPAVEDQASDRVHRIGQERPVTIYKLVSKGTVEEKVLQMHGDKRDLASGLLKDSDAVAKLDMKELLDLI